MGTCNRDYQHVYMITMGKGAARTTELVIMMILVAGCVADWHRVFMAYRHEQEATRLEQRETRSVYDQMISAFRALRLLDTLRDTEGGI